jgi:hypothetical protein
MLKLREEGWECDRGMFLQAVVARLVLFLVRLRIFLVFGYYFEL